MIRPATGADAAAVQAIWNVAIAAPDQTFASVPKTLEQVQAVLEARAGQAWVLELSGQVAGFVHFGQFRPGEGYAHTGEHTVQVADGVRGGGYGHALMQAMEEGAAHQGFATMIAGISAPNEGSLRFHAARGYVECGRIPMAGYKNKQWFELVLMQKKLIAAP